MGYSKKISSILFSAAMCFPWLFSAGNADEPSTEVATQVVYTTPWEALDHGQELTCDLILKWYESIENEDEDAEFTGTMDELSKKTQWLLFLTKAGAAPGDEEDLEKEIEAIVEACREDKNDCEEDIECMDFDCERIRNLADIPEYLKVFLLPEVRAYLSRFVDSAPDL
jgi:hypothetical protein